MTTSYAGKTPGRFWYFRQAVKGLARTPFDKSTQPDIKTAGKHTAFSAGGLLITTQAAMPLLAIFPGILFPLAVPIAAVAGVGFSFLQGRKAFRKLRALKKSSVVTGYVREQENKWLESKTKPKLGTRISASLRGIIKKCILLGAKAGAFAGAGFAAAGAVVAGLGALHATALVPTAFAAALGGIVALPIVIGLGVAAIPAGIGIALGCRKITGTTKNAGSTAKTSFFASISQNLQAKPAAAPQNDNSPSLGEQTTVASFQAAAQPEMSAERAKAAEMRAVSRRTSSGPHFG